MLVQGAASVITSKNAMVDYTTLPLSRWEHTSMGQIKPPEGANAFVTVVFEQGSRFVAEEGAIHHQEVRGRSLAGREAEVGSRTIQMLRSAKSRGGGGGGFCAQLLYSLTAESGGGSSSSGKPSSILQLQLAASKSMAKERRQRGSAGGEGMWPWERGEADTEGSVASGGTYGAAMSSGLSGWQAAILASSATGRRTESALLASRARATGSGAMGSGGESADGEKRSTSRMIARAVGSALRADSRGHAERSTCHLPSMATRMSSSRESHVPALTRRQLTVKGLHGNVTSDVRATGGRRGCASRSSAALDSLLQERAAIPSLSIVDQNIRQSRKSLPVVPRAGAEKKRKKA